MYVVTAGRARLWTPDLTVDIGPGSVLFVPAEEEHRFIDVTEDLTLLVSSGGGVREAESLTCRSR